MVRRAVAVAGISDRGAFAGLGVIANANGCEAVGAPEASRPAVLAP